ncbi:MAG: hypothetical protein AB7S78_13905 [Candidatus Omnitrophota bacterium]
MNRTLFFTLGVFFTITLVSFPIQKAESVNSDQMFYRLVEEADLIVEGTVKEIYGDAQRKVQGYVGQPESPILLKFGKTIVAGFTAEKVHKGFLKEPQSITIFSDDQSSGKSDQFSTNKKYLLFLKRHKFKDGYVVMDRGHCEWIVFDYNGILKVKSWSQLPLYRPIDQYMDYSELIQRIETSLVQLQSSK